MKLASEKASPRHGARGNKRHRAKHQYQAASASKHAWTATRDGQSGSNIEKAASA